MTVRRALPTAVAALALVTVAAARAAAPAQPAGRGPTVRGQRLDADGAVRVWNLVGSVGVVGWARDSVAVVGRVGPGGRLFVGGGPRGVKVGVEAAGDSTAAVLELRVPHGARVWVKTATAPVAVTGLVGDVELYSVSGAVHVAGRPATLRAESLAGAVTVDDGADWARIRTSSGAIRVRGPVSDGELTTVGGRVWFGGRVDGRARLESVTGAVDFAGAVAPGAALTVDTHAGDVTLALPRSGAALDLLALHGRVTSPVAALRARVRPAGRGEAVRADAPPGAGRVEVRSFRGRITVGG
jgi:hypothetical protein